MAEFIITNNDNYYTVITSPLQSLNHDDHKVGHHVAKSVFMTFSVVVVKQMLQSLGKPIVHHGLFLLEARMSCDQGMLQIVINAGWLLSAPHTKYDHREDQLLELANKYFLSHPL